MKSKESIEQLLIKSLREQADRLENGKENDIIMYKAVRQQIPVLEDILELNVLNS